MNALATVLARFDRLGLAHLPTPLEPMKRLSAHLGGPRLWVKREDCTGVGFGGNKLRKLDYVLREAVDSDADTLVSGGVVQSNSQRQVAAVAGSSAWPVISRSITAGWRRRRPNTRIPVTRCSTACSARPCTTVEAIRLAAQTLVLDPVSSGKGLAVPIAQIKTGRWTADQDVVFIHTGGAPALFAYRHLFT